MEIEVSQGEAMDVPLPPARNKSEDTVIFTGATPTALDEKDAIERLVEGLKYAASQARELNARQHNIGWNSVRESLSAMIKSVRALATRKSDPRQTIDKRLDFMSRQISGGNAV